MPDRARPFALFTAGPVGAGKSELTAVLLERYDLASLDSDEITAFLAALKPERSFWALRPLALRLLDRWQGALIARSASLLVNTTAADLAFVGSLQDRLAAQGYACAMVFVVADAAECHARNAARSNPRPDHAVERTLAVCSVNRPALERMFVQFQTVENRGGIAMFRERTRREIWSWLDRLPAPPPFP